MATSPSPNSEPNNSSKRRTTRDENLAIIRNVSERNWQDRVSAQHQISQHAVPRIYLSSHRMPLLAQGSLPSNYRTLSYENVNQNASVDTPYQNYIGMSDMEGLASTPEEQKAKQQVGRTPGSRRTIIYCVHGNNPAVCCEIAETDMMYAGSLDFEPGAFRNFAPSMTHPTDSIGQDQEIHCHDKLTDLPKVDKVARTRLLAASVLCLCFMIAEVVGGLLSNSLAIATDAAHLLTDFASFMISLFALWLASRPATRQMSFGWYRAEVLGALISVLMIWVVTGVLVYMAIERVVNKTFEIDAEIMLITASLGVAVNIVMGISLQIGGVPHGHSHGGGGHGHSHGSNGRHSHNHDSEANDNHDHDHGNGHASEHTGSKNLNVRAAFIHVVGDFFQSLGVLIAALVIYFKPEWAIVDPICTFLFSILVLITTFNIIKDALHVLMEGIPNGIDFHEVQRTLVKTPGVLKVHNLRIWSLSMDKIALSTHLAIAKDENPTVVLKRASSAVKAKFDIFELTIQVEEYRDEMQDCSKCQNPA